MDPVSLARALSAEFAASAGEVDRTARFPVENITRLKSTGYLSMPLPQGIGSGADLRTVCEAQAALAGGCASTALAVNMHLFVAGWCAEALAQGEEAYTGFVDRLGSGVVVGGSFSEPEVGGRSPTIAQPVAGGYVVNGRRPFCSLAPVLDLCHCTAKVEGTGTVIAFWIPRKARGLCFEDTWDTMSMRGTGSWDMVLDDVFVPESLTSIRPASSQWNRRAESAFAWFTLTISAVYLGIAEAAASLTIKHLRSAGRDDSAAVAAAATVELALRPARTLLFDAVERRRTDMLTAATIAFTKYVVTDAAARAVDRCLQVSGAAALYRRLPLERMYRDVRAGPFHPPSNDRALEIIGREVLAR